MKRGLLRFLREDRGQDLVEYALLGAFIALAVTGAMTFLADSIATEYNTVATTVTTGPS